MAVIPRILHQGWWGPKPQPKRLMQTWIDMNPGWEYRLCTRLDGWRNQAQFDAMREWNGKSDIARYELLLNEGGVWVDTDSECLKPLDDLLDHECWASWEHENLPYVSTAFLGAVPGTSLFREMVERVPTRNLQLAAWRSVGPVLFTEVAKRHRELHIYPAIMFSPVHHTGRKAKEVSGVSTYARHLWGTSKSLYGKPEFT